MKNNPITKVQVIPQIEHQQGAVVILHRQNRSPREVKEGKQVAVILAVLNNGTYTSHITTDDMWIDAEYHRCRIKGITYRPMELSESGYREVLSMVFNWFNNNVDGVLEEVRLADNYWHLLGAIVGLRGTDIGWSRKDHQEAFLRETDVPDAWRTFFRTKGK